MKKNALILLLLAVGLASCSPESPPLPDPVEESQAVLISNEGNFGNGNGTLSLYNRQEKTIQHKIFEGVNAEPLGNVFQSIAQIGELYYLVINNSQKIVICDLDFNKVGEIDGFTSPREIVAVDANKAYVSDLFAGKVWVVDLQNRLITGSLPIGGWSEHLLLHKQLCYINSVDKQRIYVVNTTNDQIVDSLVLSMQAQGVVIDGQEGLWVLGSGWGVDSSRLFRYDLSSLQLLESLVFAGEASRLVYNAEDAILYYINGGVYQLNAYTPAAPTLFAEDVFDAPYALAYDVRYRELYLSDAHDYQQQSTIYRYAADGSLLDDFKAGIISGDFYFPL